MSGTDPTTQFYPSYNTAADVTIATLLITCFMFGSVLNIITILYFGKLVRRGLAVRRDQRTSKKLLYNGLYFLNSLNDFMICFTVLPVAVSLLQDRDGAWFDNFTFCTIWGALWEILPYISIMYVMVLSLTRTFHLLLPLREIRIRVIALIISLYTLFCVTRSLVPAFSHLGVYTFHKDSVYCFEWARLRYSSYVRFAEYSDVIQLSVPLPPILIACTVSTLVIYWNRSNTSMSANKTGALQRHASHTIIFFTLLYIVLNIPVIALCVLYTGVFVNNQVYHRVFNTRFLYWYSWNCIYILGVTLNANLNPVIYFWRMNNFRSYVRSFGRKKTVPIRSNSVTYQNRTVGNNRSCSSVSIKADEQTPSTS